MIYLIIIDMKTKLEFPFKNKDVVSFPDTDSEFVDVGLGGCNLKVAETTFRNLLIVRKVGKGFRFEMEYDYSEVFGRNLTSKFQDKRKRKFIPTKEYLNYFGDYSDLQYECVEEDLRIFDDELEKKYGL